MCDCGIGHWAHPLWTFSVDPNYQAGVFSCSVVWCSLGSCSHMFSLFVLCKPRVLVAKA